jgi:hypothetical protein
MKAVPDQRERPDFVFGQIARFASIQDAETV